MTSYIRSHSDLESSAPWQILEASAASVYFCFFGSFAVIWYGGRVVHNGLDFWFLNLLTDSLPIEQLADIEDSLFNTSLFLQNTSFNGALLFLFWIFIGIMVYEIIQGLVFFFFEVQEETHFIMYEKPGEQHHVPSLIKATLIKTCFRFVLASTFIAYLFTCLKIIWPSLLSVFISRLSEHRTIIDFLIIVVSFVSILVSFHGLVIVARLLAMRNRIF